MGAKTLSSRAIIGAFYEALAVNDGMDLLNLISMEFDSDQESEEYKWLGMTPAMREWIGTRHAKGFRENGIAIKNKKFEATLEVLVDEIRRDKTSQVMLRIGELADRTNSHWLSLISTLIKNGETLKAYDGQNFFSATHSEGNSGTLKNLLTASEVAALNVVTAAAPTASEMADIIMGLVSYFFNYKDDQGEPIHENAKSFLIMVPVNMWAPAQTAVSSNLLNTGSGARDNPLKGWDLSVKVGVNARFTEVDELYAFRTDARTKPVIRQTEEGVIMQAIAEGSEHEFKTDSHLYGVTARRNVGFGMWQHAIKAHTS